MQKHPLTDANGELIPVGTETGLPAAPPSGGWQRFLKTCRAHRWRTFLVALVLLLPVFLGSLDALLAGPMRTWAERTMNSKLNGYTVRIARVRPHLWRLAFDLDDLVLVQNLHPVPPVADIGALQFSTQLHELLRFKLAATLNIQRPALHIDLPQIEAEARSHVGLKARGWQSAVEALYPVKFDRITVQDGSLVYLSSDTASKPLQLTKVTLIAQNVRNIATAKSSYPSPVSLEADLFDTGKVRFKGAADFLREPFTAARGEIRLDRVPLDRLAPLAQAYQLKTTGGFLSVDGAVEYSPESQMAHLREVRFDELRVDFVTSKATRAVEKQHGREVAKLARKVRDAPHLLLRMDTLKLEHSQIGFENKATHPPYRVFMSEVSLDVKNLGNQAGEGRSEFNAHGAFMGSGTTVLSGGARTTANQADFDLRLKLDDAKLSSLNGLLMAHAGVDVAEGLFSVYTEIAVRNGRVEGYIKPFIRNLKIYDKKKDSGKRFGKRVEMHVLQFLSGMLRNRSTREVATVARISGSTRDPKTNEWEMIRKLIGNGLVRAIRPGFLDHPKATNHPK